MSSVQHHSPASARHDPPLSRPALLASLSINALAWSGLWLVYQRATDDMAPTELRRTPIVWLRLPPAASQDVGMVDATSIAPRGALSPAASTSTMSPVSVNDEAPSTDSSSVAVMGSDHWYPHGQGVDVGAADGAGERFAADPLQLRRHRPIPASISQLQLRMRSAGGLAASAQLKVCGVLLTQWEGMRLDAAAAEVPFGLPQPAGRDVVWRSLQAEGCLD